MLVRRTAVLALVSLALVAQVASAKVKIQTFDSGQLDSTSIVADRRGNVYVLSEFATMSRMAPDGGKVDVPFVPPTGPQTGGPRSWGMVWGPDDALWLTCNDVICHVDPDGGGLIDSPSRYGTPGPDGSFWTVDGTSGTVSRITVYGVVTTFHGLEPLPAGSYPGRPVAGPNGDMWFIYGNALVSVTASGSIASHQLPPTLKPGPGVAVAAGPDGNLWMPTIKGIARLSPDGRVLGRYPLEGTPEDVAPGPDGDVWFTYRAVGGIGRITPSGHVSEFSEQIAENAEPASIVRAADGGMWVTAFHFRIVWRIDPALPVATTESPSGIGVSGTTLRATVDPQGGPTSASFEYGTTTAYGAQTAALDVGDGEGGALVATAVADLKPGTTYHYRVVAVNGMRTVYGADRTLRTADPMVPPKSTEGEVDGASAIDADHDGYPANVDCNDHAKSIHPGARDRPGDRVDQDCSGSPASYGHLAPPIDARWVTHGRLTRFTRLTAGALPARAVITLSCAGRGCGLKSYKSRMAAATKHTNLLRHLKASKLRRGAVVELRLSQAGQATTIIRWRIGPPMRRVTTCRDPGARRETPCA